MDHSIQIKIVGNGFASDFPMTSEDKTKKKIIIIDDDPTMRKALRLLLTSEMYDVTEATNGKQAVKKISKHGFDLIITDLFLDGMTGLDIFKKFRKKMPVLIITGYGDSPLARRVKQETGVTYMEKPFSSQAFKDIVKSLLSKKMK